MYAGGDGVQPGLADPQPGAGGGPGGADQCRHPAPPRHGSARASDQGRPTGPQGHYCQVTYFASITVRYVLYRYG
jgi:hypothetical protein